MIERKNIALCIVLSIITCGIYMFYWMVCLQNDMNQLSDDYKTSGGLVVLLTIVTCGIYGVYWAFTMGDRIDRMKQSRGIPASNSGILYLLLYLVGGVISLALMQNEINLMA